MADEKRGREVASSNVWHDEQYMSENVPCERLPESGLAPERASGSKRMLSFCVWLPPLGAALL